MKRSTSGLFTLLIVLLSVYAEAQSVQSGISYHGRLLKNNGSAVTSTTVQFQIQIRTPGSENCLLYSEIQTKDLSLTNGAFSITLNDGSGTRNDGNAWTLDQVFANKGTLTFSGGACATGTTRTFNTTDGRRIVVMFNDGSFSGWEQFPAEGLNFVPMSIESQQVSGFRIDNMIRSTATFPELNNTQATELMSLINGTSTAFQKSSNLVQGTIASRPAAGVAGRLYIGTDDSTIYRDDGTTWTALSSSGGGAGGSIAVGSAGTPSLNFTGNTNTGVYSPGANIIGFSVNGAEQTRIDSTGITAKGGLRLSGSTSGYVGLKSPAVGGTTTFTLPAADGTSGQVLSTNGAAVLGWISPGTVTNVTSANSYLSVATGTTTPALTLNVGTAANTVAAGDDSRITGAHQTATTLGGDLSGTLPNPTVAKINGTAVSSSAPSSGQFLKYGGTNWAGSVITLSDLKSTISGNLFSSPNCSASQTLTWVSGSDQFSCQSIGSLNASAITAGTLGITNGGTGQTTAGAAFNALAPSQTGNSGKYLTSDGTNTSWATPAVTFPLAANPIGTASAPAYSFTSDSNTGLYSPAADTVSLSTGGTDRLYINSSGNVGVGNTNPTGGKVHITQGSTNPGLQIDMGGNDAGSGAFLLNQLAASSSSTSGRAFQFMVNGEGFARGTFYSDGAYGMGGGAATRDLYIKRYSAGNLMIDGDKAGSSANLLVTGSLGIGTTSPGNKLHIAVNAAAVTTLLKLDQVNSSAGAGANIQFNAGGNEQASIASFWDAVTQQSLVFYTGNSHTERIRIDGSGNMGIGLTNPAQRLDVSGNIQTSGCLYYASSSLGTCASDVRLKKDIHSFDLGLEALLGIHPVYFKYNGRGGFKDNGKEQTGVIAQDLEKSAPSLVKKQLVQMNPEDKEKTEIKVVDYGAFVYVIINSIKELHQRWEERSTTAERQIAALQQENQIKAQKIEDLNRRLEALEKALQQK